MVSLRPTDPLSPAQKIIVRISPEDNCTDHKTKLRVLFVKISEKASCYMYFSQSAGWVQTATINLYSEGATTFQQAGALVPWTIPVEPMRWTVQWEKKKQN